MKISVILIALLIFSACTVSQSNTNQKTVIEISTPVALATATPQIPARWSVAVCSSRSKTVMMSAGPNETDSEVFATWKEGSTQKVFNFPARVQNLSSVYFKASGSDKNQVELCILYDGKPKRRIEFDDDEDATITSSDTNDNECRCAG